MKLKRSGNIIEDRIEHIEVKLRLETGFPLSQEDSVECYRNSLPVLGQWEPGQVHGKVLVGLVMVTGGYGRERLVLTRP